MRLIQRTCEAVSLKAALAVAYFFLQSLTATAAPLNVAPNPSFELAGKRLGGWMPLGPELTNEPARVLITNTLCREGSHALQVRPGPPGVITGRAFEAGHNGGEEQIRATATNGVRGTRTIALRLDPDTDQVYASIWIHAPADARFTLSLVWTGRELRRPAEVIHVDRASESGAETNGWRPFSISATRPLRAHQVQLWIETDSLQEFYLDDAEITFHRAPSQMILVDQLGYESASTTKVALLQASDDQLAPLPARLIDLRDFREVLRSEWQRCAPIPDWDRVHWTFDFSSVTNPGRYAVAIGEAKRTVSSPVFEIGDHILERHAAEPGYRFFYYQRCGTAIPGFHAACHLDDARMPDGSHRDFSGAWHDAGDYNKYCGFTPESCYSLALAYHRKPALFRQWDRDGNGRADLLDEAIWGADFLLKAIDPASLELVAGTISTGYRYWDEPQKETDNVPGNRDDRPVTQVGGDRTWCAAALALTGAAVRTLGDTNRGESMIRLATRLYEKIGGNLETLAALYSATRERRYLDAVRAQVEHLLQQPKPEDHFRALGEFAAEFPEDSLTARIRPVAERRIAALQEFCVAPFQLARYPGPHGPVYFQSYEDVNDWYVGGTMRHLDVAIEGALAARLGVGAGRSLAENQVHWILGRNPFGVSLMEAVGEQFVPGYHHRYNTLPGNPRGAVPGALLNGIVRAWPHQDRPWLDMTPEPSADYHCNEPWIPYNNRWMILMSAW